MLYNTLYVVCITKFILYTFPPQMTFMYFVIPKTRQYLNYENAFEQKINLFCTYERIH